VRDLLLDPHLEDRGFFWLIDHAPAQGAGPRAWVGPTAQLSRTPAALHDRAPMLGEHNERVATGLLGMSRGEYNDLVADGSFGTLPAAADIELPDEDTEARTRLPRTTSQRLGAVDHEHLKRLRARFGDGFGRAGS
jgi:hypothetical protein